MLIFQLLFSLYILYFVVVSIEGLMEDWLLLNVLPSQNKDDYYYYYYYWSSPGPFISHLRLSA